MNFWQSTANCQNHMKIYGTNEENEITNNKITKKGKIVRSKTILRRRCWTVYLKVFVLHKKIKQIFLPKIFRIYGKTDFYHFHNFP